MVRSHRTLCIGIWAALGAQVSGTCSVLLLREGGGQQLARTMVRIAMQLLRSLQSTEYICQLGRHTGSVHHAGLDSSRHRLPRRLQGALHRIPPTFGHLWGRCAGLTKLTRSTSYFLSIATAGIRKAVHPVLRCRPGCLSALYDHTRLQSVQLARLAR